MKDFIEFEIIGEPFGKLNMRPIIVNGHARAFSPNKNNRYMDSVITSLEKNEIVKNAKDIIFPKGTPVYVIIVAYFKIPDTHYKFYRKENKWRYDSIGEKMLNGEILPTKRPDLDNISKVVCDGISHSGKIWHDDSQIVGLTLTKRYEKEPKVVVCIFANDEKEIGE